jgi:predicted N-acetyltransferase YhbS
VIRDPGRLRLLRERPRDGAAVEAMNEAAFGPERQQKTVYRLREDVKPIRELCFVAIDQKDRMVASIRNWPILINEKWPAVMLGPLAISPELRGLGYGKALMWHSMAQSRMLGHSRIILVGDPEYYNQFGFRRDLALNIQLPGWVEDRRFLALELVAGSMIGVHGMIGKWQAGWRPSKRKTKK